MSHLKKFSTNHSARISTLDISISYPEPSTHLRMRDIHTRLWKYPTPISFQSPGFSWPEGASNEELWDNPLFSKLWLVYTIASCFLARTTEIENWPMSERKSAGKTTARAPFFSRHWNLYHKIILYLWIKSWCHIMISKCDIEFWYHMLISYLISICVIIFRSQNSISKFDVIIRYQA